MAGTPLKQNTAEGGSNATTVTTGNSGSTSGDAFDAVSIGASNGLVFQTSGALRGTLSYKFTKASTNQNFVGWTWTGAQADIGINIRFRFPAGNLAATEPLIRFFSGAGYTPQIGGVQLVSGSGRKINVSDTALASSVDSSASLALGGDYVAQVRWISGTSITVNVYTAGTTTLIATSTTPASASSVNSLRIGLTGSGNSAVDLIVDDIQVNYGGLPDRLDISNVAPTVDAGTDQSVAAAATVNLTATASDTDGTIASYAWTYDYPVSGGPTLTGGTTSTPSFTAGSAGALYILRCTVTDNGGATAFDTVTVAVPRAGSATSRPLAGAGTGGAWTNTGGAASAGAALADESDTTYLESPALSGSETAYRVRLDPSGARATANVKLKLWTDTGTANTTIRLIEGSTTRQTWTQALTTTITEYTFALSTPTIAAISDWGNLYVEVGATT